MRETIIKPLDTLGMRHSEKITSTENGLTKFTVNNYKLQEESGHHDRNSVTQWKEELEHQKTWHSRTIKRRLIITTFTIIVGMKGIESI